MKRIWQAAVCILVVWNGVAVTYAQTASEEERAVYRVLDALHQAASEADGVRYFGLYTEDAIFLGTDATERWTLDDFKAYARPYFEQGRGWTYLKTSRHIYFSADRQTAWFDETLTNENLGECRGSGVLVKVNDRWRVAQYNLSIPIPNALAGDVVELIRKQ